jgi:hypothetical protein
VWRTDRGRARLAWKRRARPAHSDAASGAEGVDGQQLGRALGCPAMSLATLARRVREQANWCWPRLVAKGDPEEATVLAALHQEIATLPEGAVILGRGRVARQPAALAAIDVDRQRRAAGGDDAGQEPTAQHLRRH